MRILHIADVHLDRPFVGLDRDAARARRDGLRAAFDRCLDVARERKTDLITIGGDLWEDEHVTPDTLRWVASRLADAGRPVVLVAGNHDPLSPGGPYDRAGFGDTVTVLSADSGLASVSVGDITIRGTSWEHSQRLTASGLREFRALGGTREILLLHGTCGGGFHAESGYCPFTADQVRAAGFELCLAGHLHSGGIRDEIVVYPGSPEPLGWAETGRHTAAIVDLPPGGPPVIELVDINEISCLEITVDVSDAASSADVERRVDTQLDARELTAGTALKLDLVGRVAVGCDVAPGTLRARVALRGVVDVRVVDRTRPAFDLDVLGTGIGAQAFFVQRMRECIAAGDATAELALELGLRALEGETL